MHKKNDFAKLASAHGFTLLELLVVMVIIGLLVGVVGPKYFGQLHKSQVKAARAQIESFHKALDVYRLDNGSYPSTEQGLMALVSVPQGMGTWQGPYLQKSLPMDPWQHAYVYRNPGAHADVDVISLGADGQIGGDGENSDIFE